MSHDNDKLNFVIASSAYNEDSGGSIVAHQLCHLINQFSNANAYMFPYPRGTVLNYLNAHYLDKIKQLELSNYQNYQSTSSLNAPILEDLKLLQDKNTIAVYTEVVHGNPFRSPNVARWLLHTPGFHRGEFCFSLNEVQFIYQTIFKPVFLENYLEVAPFILHVISHPELTKDNLKNNSRSGVAYCIRKGNYYTIPQITENAIKVDTLSYNEIRKVFDRVEFFISFDTETFLSQLAVFHGCQSIVIPEPGVTIDDWDTTGRKRCGVAYGFNDLHRAQITIDSFFEMREKEKIESIENTKKFVEFWGERLNNNI